MSFGVTENLAGSGREVNGEVHLPAVPLGQGGSEPGSWCVTEGKVVTLAVNSVLTAVAELGGE